MSNQTYIEDCTITIPVLKDGVTRIGDLWNCRESKTIGENIFKQNVDGIYVNVSPIESLEYQLIHSKSFSDKFKSFDIGGEVSLEMKAGLMKVKGLFDYDRYKDVLSIKEEIICNYSRETYSIYAQANADELLNDTVINKIINKKINATHLVRGVILGAEVRAEILVSQERTDKKHGVIGDLLGNIVFGPINALVKAKLCYLDSYDFGDFKKEINIHSIPSMKLEPKTIEEMFKMIENIGLQVDEHKHFPNNGDKVVGVPIRFILVPIKQYFKVKIERKYLKISEQICRDFNEMLVKVQEIQVPSYISRKILESNSNLALILDDPQSKLSNEIIEFEKNLHEIGRRYFEESVEIFKQYKTGQLSIDKLIDIRDRFEKECNTSEIFEKVLEFINSGETELVSLNSVDIVNSKINLKILTNNNVLKQFINDVKEIKILLQIASEAPAEIFLKFSELVEPLSKLNIKFGVAVRSISEKTALIIKVRAEEYTYDSIEDIPYILGIIGATVGVGNKNEVLFHSINAEIINTTLPFTDTDQMSDINHLIKRLLCLKNVIITRSRLETLSLLTTNDDKWRVFISIDAVETRYSAIRNLPNLISSSSMEGVEWIVGNTGLPGIRTTGFLFIVKNSKVIAICLDDFDILLFREKFLFRTENDLEIISPRNMRYSFYPERALSSENMMKNIELHSHIPLDIPEYGLKSFEESVNQNLLNALELACCFIHKDELNLLNFIAKWALEENGELIEAFSHVDFSFAENKFQEQNMSETNKKFLAEALRQILEKVDSLSTKIVVAKEVLNEEIFKNDESKLSQIIADIQNDPQCTDELRKNMIVPPDIDFSSKRNHIKSCLERFEDKFNEKELFFHTKMLHLMLISNQSNIFPNIFKNYLNRITLDESIFPSAKTGFLKDLEEKLYNQLIIDLSKYKHGIKYFIMQEWLKIYSCSSDVIGALEKLLIKLSDQQLFNETNLQELWKNNRFDHIIRMSINDHRILVKLFQMLCKERIPSYIPSDIVKILEQLREDENDFELSPIITNLDQFLDTLKTIIRRKHIPDNFRSVLANSIDINEEFYIKLDQLKILELFKYEKSIFPKAIELNTINEAVEKIEQFEDNTIYRKKTTVDNYNMSFKRLSSIPSVDKYSVNPKYVNINEKFKKVYGNSLKIISSSEFNHLTSIIEKPQIADENISQTVLKVMPYIVQKIKMWGCNALTADKISGLICSETNRNESLRENFSTEIRHSFRRKVANTIASNQKNLQQLKTPKSSLSRIDTIVGIMNSIDSIVAQDMLCIMAKFPMSLPLIIREVHDDNSFKLLLPWYTKACIKWESTPGKIIENQLFIDNFKMVATLRLGNVSDGKIGKSTIFNQLLNSKNVFSSIAEPLAERGKPISLDGTVEFICLTQETVSPKLWESVLQDHYKSGSNELLLLANLHGNALNHENILILLREIASSFIIFIMPDESETASDNGLRLEEILDPQGDSNKIFYVAIDPPSYCDDFDESVIIETTKISNDYNIGKLRNILKSSLNFATKKIDSTEFAYFGNIEIAETIETPESQNLIEFIINNSCEYVKKNMPLQKGSKSHEQMAEIWRMNDELKNIINMIGEVLSLKIESRIKALSHLEQEIGRLSAKESSKARKDFLTAHENLQKTLGSKTSDAHLAQQWRLRLNEALKRIDDISLGSEHFFREIGKLYELFLANNPLENPFIDLPKKYAELMIAGQAIELLDGDSGSMTASWFRAICENVYQQIPHMRIFVISILGLQSSGKSTLLNALFSCKFAVSVGRCTKGLFMRLLFLDDSLKKRLGFNAVLLIDTEGLGAPEKQNEIDAEKKDRLLATFVMGVSHLTIVNVLGEYMRDLTEILQIAIVAMARLEKADVSPDILMVQHLTERNTEKISSASQRFGESLENAIKIADERDINLGVRDSKCLNKLRQTIALGKLFRQFRPFKNGASVNSPPSEEYHQDVVELYNSILDIAEKSSGRFDFKDWQELVTLFWDGVKNENFMRFKDVKDLQEFLQRSDLISKLKESIESAFREHSEALKGFITEQAKRLNKKEITRDDILKSIQEKLKLILSNCSSEPQCARCLQVIKNQTDLKIFVDKKPNEHEANNTVYSFIERTRKWYYKQLSQMLSAIAFSQMTSADILNKIDIKLKAELNLKKKFSENDIEETAQDIWVAIEKEAADQVMLVPVSDQIKEEIPQAYLNTNPLFLKEFENKPVKTLRSKPAVHKVPQSLIGWVGMFLYLGEEIALSNSICYELEEEIESFGQKILKEENAHVYHNGMVAKLKVKLLDLIDRFEKKNSLKLTVGFKWEIHLFGNQKFCFLMEKLQKKWDELHNPLTILRRNKSQYISVINERLKKGFNIDSDGIIAGKCLLSAIKQKAIKSANARLINDVLDISWLVNTESVRLKYFSELVDQIRGKKFSQALNHFDDPKNQIDIWFMDKVNNVSTGKEYLEFNEVMVAEIKMVIQDVRRHSNVAETIAFIEDYISLCDGIYFPGISDPDINSEIGFSLFSRRIIEILNRSLKNLPKCTKIDLSLPSDNYRVMDRLGCTYACPICSALCWGQSMHHEDDGDLKYHHTCHQPMGLSGTSFKNTSILSAELCHEQETNKVWYVENEQLPWCDVMKLDKYKNWKYTSHVNGKFDDLMKWFFIELNAKMAARYGKIPATKDELKSLNITSLDIGKILAEINQKI